MMDMDKFKQNSCVYYIASHGLKKITDCYNDTIKAYGATRVQWIALYYIENSDGIRQTELAEQMDSRETTIARLAGRLIKNGLVERRADDNDRRAVKLYCTEEGHAMYKRLLPVCEDFNKKISRNIPENELLIFRSVLDRLIENSKKD